jgi:maleylacetoacetate isomerase
VRIALNLKKIPHNTLPVHLRKQGGQHLSARFLGINPQGLVPVWEEGDWRLHQSLAIVEYLDSVNPEPELLPAGERARAEVRALSLMICCEIHPLTNLRVLQYLRSGFGLTDEAVTHWIAHWIRLGLSALEAKLAHSGGQFCFGNQVSLADLCLVPQMYNARRFGCDLEPYSHLVSIDRHLNSIDAIAQAAPENQPDAE